MKFGKMKPHRRNRLLLVVFLIITSGSAVGLGLMALNENINLFYSPQQIVDGEAPVGPTIRAGGMVVDGSVQRSSEDLKVSFIISDMEAAQVEIQFEGILPDLFREGQGVIALGALNPEGVFVADEVLAKHDENYMPPEVSDALADAHKESSGK
jgi:cytochrome c-type biogenesis protein CcmE